MIIRNPVMQTPKASPLNSPADAIEMLYMYFGSSNTARQGSSTPEPQ